MKNIINEILKKTLYVCYDVIEAISPLAGYQEVINPHVTLVFKPSLNEATTILEQNPRFKEFNVIGYGCNDTNEAVSVEKPMNCNNSIAHITLSHKGRPVDSNLLEFSSDHLDYKLKDRNIPKSFLGVLTFVTTDGKRWNL